MTPQVIFRGMNNPLLARSSRLLRLPFVCCQCRRWASQGRVFKEGDKVIVKRANRNEDDGWIFTLSKSQKIESHKGFIPHQEIIGRPSGALVRSHVGAQFRVFEPSLAEYVTLSRRLVTPIYPEDANLIVNLLDLHPPAPEDTTYDDRPLQILEVGTGQGSLTLHIAKAIHGYNESARLMEREGASRMSRRRKLWLADAIGHTAYMVGEQVERAQKIVEKLRQGLDASKVEPLVRSLEEYSRKIFIYLAYAVQQPPARLVKDDERKAILHTTDVVQKHSQHAENIVKGFRHGLYADNVNFHIGTMEDFFRKIMEKTVKKARYLQLTSASLDSSNEIPLTNSPTTETPTSTYTPLQPSIPPFLSHILIDTQSAHKQIELATKYLLPGGKIITFNPSITQIGECTEQIKRLNLPLDQETVLELGQNISGGKVWDVRAITPRVEERRAEQARLKEAERKVMESESTNEGQAEIDALSDIEAVEEEATKKAIEEQKFVMVCRPKVGKMIIGGGFVGVWRKIAD